MIEQIRKLVSRAFAGFPDRYVTRVGVIQAIHDWHRQEEATDRFRPRYAVDVQLLLPTGDPDESRPPLEALPLPAHIVGDGAGLFGYPAVGTRVRVGFDYGLPSHPYVHSIIPQGQALPTLRPGEVLFQQQDGAFLRFDAQGNAVLRTDGELRQDAHRIVRVADEMEDQLGALTRMISGDESVTVGGSRRERVLGAFQQEIGGHARIAILGGEERVTLGDRSELAAGKWEQIAGQGLVLKSATLDVLIEAVLGSAQFKSAVALTLDSLAINLGSGATEPLVLGNAFMLLFNAHTHSASGAGPPNTPMSAGLHTSAVVNTK